MQYIYFYIIMKYVALILLNYEYIIYRSHSPRHLKGLAHAKIVKKSVILFGVLNMTI